MKAKQDLLKHISADQVTKQIWTGDFGRSGDLLPSICTLSSSAFGQQTLLENRGTISLAEGMFYHSFFPFVCQLTKLSTNFFLKGACMTSKKW